MSFLLLLFLVLVSSYLSINIHVLAQTCTNPPSATSDIYPLSPSLTLPGILPTNKIYANCSEKVLMFTQGGYTYIPWLRDNCPHHRSDLILSSPLVAATDVVITVPTLLRPCHLPPNNGVINRITIQSGAALVLDDIDMTLHVREIVVASGGSLHIGSSTCRLYSRIQIIFYGTKLDSSLTNDDVIRTSKGILSQGEIQIHGKQYHPTWTRLARTSTTASNLLYLQDIVNWEVGQEILITTTIHLDCPVEWQSWCRPCWSWDSGCSTHPGIPHQNERRIIIAITTDADGRGSVLQLDQGLTYSHYAGSEYQAEVALLSRRIVLRGVQSNDNFGGHTKIIGSYAQGRFAGVQADNMGQLNVLARYPFHYHMMGEQNRDKNYIQDCVVTNSHFRGFVIHGTNNTRLSRNVAYNVKGMCYYLEDGVEERNTLEYNLAAHVHPIYRPASGGWGQSGEDFTASADLIIPADTSASGFYIPNAYNTFIGNAASGGWSGFAFPNTPAPLGAYKDSLPINSVYNPDRRPLLKFIGNTAHSSGFYWKEEHGSCFYVGAHLRYEAGVLTYNSGRHERNTVAADGTESIMKFEHTKAALCIKGLAHWGNRVAINFAEMSDVRTSAMLFGEASMSDALVNGRTPNHDATGNRFLGDWKQGFQFYDTWVKTIISRITFRNFVGTKGDRVIRYMDHSDQFLPQGINAVSGLRFENLDASAIIGLQNCGSQCGGDNYTTMSSRLYAIWDYDGSLTRTGSSSIIGSNSPWWQWSSECVFRIDMGVWTCPWYPRTTLGYFGIKVPGLMNGCDASKSPNYCSSQRAGYTVGRLSHWSTASLNNAINLSPWPGVTGLTNTGWYWRAKSAVHSIDGAPSQFTIDEFQLAKGHFVVLAIRYPATAQFTIKMVSNWWSYTHPNIPMASSLAAVLNKTENIKPSSQINCAGDWQQWWRFCTAAETGGIGPAWYFDGTHLYLRIVHPTCYNYNTKGLCESSVYTAEGITIPDILNAFKYDVQVTCTGCTVQATAGGVTYWEVPDTAPQSAFSPDWGATVTGTSLTIATSNPFVCAAPPTTTTTVPTAVPTTAVPTTAVPTTAVPTTAVPTTAPTTPASTSVPTTPSATTSIPTTAAPTNTPTTVAPSTLPPTTTVAPVTAAPDACRVYSTCSSCKRTAGCGWCTSLGQCKSGNKSGSLDGNVLCKKTYWIFSTGKCPATSSLQSQVLDMQTESYAIPNSSCRISSMTHIIFIFTVALCLF